MKNTITWFDIPTLDFDRALKFYREILGTPLRVDDYLGQRLAYFPLDSQGRRGAATWYHPASTTSLQKQGHAFISASRA